jgi:hypothetical protein
MALLFFLRCFSSSRDPPGASAVVVPTGRAENQRVIGCRHYRRLPEELGSLASMNSL